MFDIVWRCALQFLSTLWLTALLLHPTHAATQSFGPFTVDDAHPGVIWLTGAIDIRTALNFRRALNAAPDPRFLVLNSPGGFVSDALLIADDIHERRIATYIPSEAGCYSACSFIFLAGLERQVDGELGVHQIDSEDKDLVSAQLFISDIIDHLNRFDTPVEVLTKMFSTPPEDMYVFNEDEISRFGINRSQSGPVASSDSGASDLHNDLPGSSSENPETALHELEESPSLAELSELEEYTRRPNRMAVFTGLDLFGNDIESRRTDDSVECAETCLSMSGECKAFTFNTHTRAGRGPNCFLKANRGTLDGNAVALSGQLLTRADPDPRPFTLGTIDPRSSQFENVDLPGGDLSKRPYGKNPTALDCRLACVDNDQCVAFTYIKRKKECWLKGSAETPRNAEGMISGLKTFMTVSPSSIISLE